MAEKEIFIKNNILGAEFDRYLIEHPEFAEKIPQGARVILLPQDDPELCEVNKKLAQHHKKEGIPVVYVTIEGLAPQKSRLLKPELHPMAI